MTQLIINTARVQNLQELRNVLEHVEDGELVISSDSKELWVYELGEDVDVATFIDQCLTMFPVEIDLL